MLPKTYVRSLITMSLFLVSIIMYATPIEDLVNETMPAVRVNFDACQSFVGGPNFDYSEFTGQQITNPACSELELAAPGYVYRSDPQNNPHSCTNGVGNSVAMCVTAYNQCFYDAGNPKSLKFNIKVTPAQDGFGSIEHVSFYEKGPEFFQFLEGNSGVNDYPTLYGIRVLVNGNEIYRQIDIPTSRDWNYVSFDFSQLGQFTVTQQTVFNFEILPYCLIGNGSFVQAFDIDELVVSGGCNNINGGIVSTTSPTEVCTSDLTQGVIDFDVQSPIGGNFAWFVTDDMGDIVQIPSGSIVDFRSFPNGNFTVYHIAFESGLQGLSQGSNINDFTGCFDISNGVSILVSDLEGGSLADPIGFSDFYICTNDSLSSQVQTVLSGAMGFNTVFFIHNTNGTIIDIQQLSNFDFSSYGDGQYFITAATHNGQLFNGVIGANISDLKGCFALSNTFRVIKQFVRAGAISINGVTELDLCGGEAMSLNPDAPDVLGSNLNWIVTNTQGQILNIFPTLPINVSNLTDETLEIRLISFLGRIIGNEVDENINDIEGCFDVSNVITVTNEGVFGGTIDVDNQTDVFICLNSDDDKTVTVDLSDEEGENSSWLLLDPNGNITDITNSNIIDFTDAEAGVCVIRNISFNAGTTGIEVGNNLGQLDGCFALSNSVSVTKGEVDAGEINSGIQTTLNVCSGDGLPDVINIDIMGADAPFQSLIITDAGGTILRIPDGNSFDFEGLASGVCLIYNVAASDSILNSAELNVNELEGCFDLSNAIEVTRDEVNGGMISSNDSTEICIIVGDGLNDNIPVDLIDNIGENQAYLVTDQDGNILDLPSGPPFNFENAGVGTCLIWSISFTDGLMGLDIDSNVSGLSGCFNLSNPITVKRTGISGGTIAFNDSLTMISVCLGDNIVESFDISLENNEGPNFAWVITSNTGEILELPSGPPFEFENAGAGTCQIWHLAFDNGLTGLAVGESVNNLSGSFNFSNNITVERSAVDGGLVTTASGLDSLTICSGDGLEDLLGLSLTDELGINSNWVVTDVDNMILEILDDAPIDFEGVAQGTCLIYHLSSNPGLIGLELGVSTNDLAGCFDLSNPITVIRQFVAGGNLLLTDSTTTTTIIAGDGISDAFDVLLDGNSGDSMIWVITNDIGEILALPDGPPFDLEGAGLGSCLIYNLSYAGVLDGLDVGSDLSAVSGCLDLSNSITVIRTEINSGQISTMDNLDLCLNTDEDNLVDAEVTGNTGTNFSWIISDTSGLILALLDTMPYDFSNEAAGICHIRHISYEDNIMFLDEGQNLSNLTGSFDVSDSIVVNKIEVLGGDLMTDDMMTSVSIMVGDGIIDSIDVVLENIVGDTTSWIITDTLGNILELPTGPPFTFEDAGGGVCQIWNLSYNFGLTGLEIMNNVSQLDGCFDLSNPITVNRMGIMGGVLMTSDGLTSLEICIDTIPDPIDVILTDTIGPVFTWLITDTLGTILDLPMGPPFDLNPAGPGVCQIWNLAHEASLTGLELMNNVSDLMGNHNFSNPITVSRSENIGGVLNTISGATQDTITLGDGEPELIGVTLTGAVGNNIEFIITDTLGNIIEVDAQAPFNFENAPEGVCQIWNLSYGDNLTGLAVDENVSNFMGCFALSNPITVVRQPLVIAAGSIMTSDGLVAVTICAGDGNPDPLDILLDGFQGPNGNYVVTDTSGIIQGLPPGGGMMTTIDLDIAGGGISEIYHVSSTNGLMGLTVGMSIDSLEGTFDISNPITVTRLPVDGGDLMTTDSLTSVTIMVGDGVIDSIDVILSGEEGDTSIWVITDQMGAILELPMAPPFTFENAGIGVCRIYNLSSNGMLNGVAIGDTIDQIIGCYNFSNPIFVNRIGLEGGNLILADGALATSICLNGGAIDSIDVVLTGNSGSAQTYIITNVNDDILALPSIVPIDISGLGDGFFILRNLAYEPGLIGLNVGENVSGFDGMFDFSNSIAITQTLVDGGVLMSASGLDTLMIQVDDMMPDTINLNLMGAVGDTSTILVTDEQGFILSLSDTTQVVFPDQAGSTCNIWNVSYLTGLVGLEVGNNVTDLDGCFALSNPVVVIKDGINGGVLTLLDGTTEANVCETTAVELFDVILTDTSGINSTWLITTEDDFIIGTPLGPPFNLQDGPTAKLYHLSWDSLTNMPISGPIANLDGIFDLSNPIIVVEETPSAGQLRFPDNTSLATVIIGEGITDSIFVNLMGNIVGDTSLYIITTTTDSILRVGEDPPFTFEDEDPGTCRIYHYAGPVGAPGVVVGNNLTDLTGCFDLTANINIVKKELNGGLIETINGLTEIEFCVGDSIPDTFDITISENLGDDQVWVVTDSSGIILALPGTDFDVDFDGSGPGVCEVYNLSSTGSIIGLTVGSSVDNLQGCFLFSNAITVTRNWVFGGELSLTGGGTEASICIDGTPDVLSFENTSMADSIVYVLTNNDNVIDTILSGNSFDFENAAIDTCKVWAISFQGMLKAMQGDTIGVDDLGGCVDLSTNVITVIKLDCPGIVIINEVSGTSRVEIKNVGLDTVDLTGYYICNDGTLPNDACDALEDLVAICGDLMLAPDEFVTFTLVNAEIDTLDGEMALYSEDSFGSNQFLESYVQWGDTLHSRTNLAIGAGVWETGQAIDSTALLSTNSLLYDGDGILASDWNAGATSICSENTFAPEEEDIDLAIKIFPNPASESMNVEMLKMPAVEGEINIFDSDGRLVYVRKDIKKGIETVDISNMRGGVYFLRAKAGVRVTTEKFIIIE